MSTTIELCGGDRTPAARAVPGAVWSRQDKTWVLHDPTSRSAAVALRLFPDVAAKYPELERLRDELIEDVRPFDNATKADLHVSDESPEVGRILAGHEQWWYEFQNLDLGYLAAVLLNHHGAYLGWERGLGKTLGACSIVDALGLNRVLVVCPNTAKEPVWKAEIERFLPHATVDVLPNVKAKRDAMFEEYCYLDWAERHGEREIEPLRVLIVHYEALHIIAKNRPSNMRGWDRMGEWDLVIADEAHRIKNPKAQMTRALKKIRTKYKLALSGSIIANHAEELFSPLQWLFPEIYSSKWRDWNDRYLDYVEGPFGRILVGIKPDKVDQMRDELGVFMCYRRKEDELDLPIKTEQTLHVDLLPEQRRAYEDLRDTCVAQLDTGGALTADEGLVMLTRLRQLATGLEVLDPGSAGSSKLDLATDLILDSEEPFVVFSWFKAAAHAMRERLEKHGVACFLVDGDVKHEDRSDYIERFQAGDGRVFIGTLSTLGESVNLHRATNAVFLDRSWNPQTNAQAADRIYRIGQTRPVTITHLVAKDTVDEYNVQPSLNNKEALRKMILGGNS